MDLKKKTVIASAILASTLVSNGSVILTVMENGSGGVILTASGSLDFSEAIFDFDNATFSNPSRGFDDGVFVFPVSNAIQESFFISSASFQNATSPNTFPIFDTFDAGTHGNGLLFIASGFIIVSNAGFIQDDAAPDNLVFDFDFTATDNDGSLDDYIDGAVLFDFNGFSNPGGQTVTLFVVPEPSSSVLLGLGGLALLVRRNRK